MTKYEYIYLENFNARIATKDVNEFLDAIDAALTEFGDGTEVYDVQREAAESEDE